MTRLAWSQNEQNVRQELSMPCALDKIRDNTHKWREYIEQIEEGKYPKVPLYYHPTGRGRLGR